MTKEINNCLEDSYYLKKVLPHFITDNVFTPSEPPKPTNIGVVLTKFLHPTDNSYGTHPAKYGGIGYEKIDHPDFMWAPRKFNHLRTGLDWEISEQPSTRQRSALVQRNKGFFAQPLHELGNEIFKAHTASKTKQIISKTTKRDNILFPKSSIYEFENIRAAFHAKLKKKQEQMEKSEVSIQDQKKEKKGPQAIENTVPCTPGSLLKLQCDEFEKTYNKNRLTPQTWVPKAPFWYDPNKSGSKSISPRNLGDYSTHVTTKSHVEHDWLEEMQLRNTQNYIPGEIYKNTIPKQAVEDLSKSGRCSSKWQPMNNEKYPFQIFDIENMTNEKSLEKEVDKRQKMTYSESLGLDASKIQVTVPFRTPCLFRQRQKSNTCGCGACKCTLDPEIGILIPDINLKCGCVKCHVDKYNEIKLTFKKTC